jgi:hypothetical protein
MMYSFQLGSNRFATSDQSCGIVRVSIRILACARNHAAKRREGKIVVDSRTRAVKTEAEKRFEPTRDKKLHCQLGYICRLP